ncbi:MAG: hypothetical protein OXE96_07920 [Gemmatimonadetes bacterium]|nr:hypothetical protein [Gemmatimonadota bacterium]
MRTLTLLAAVLVASPAEAQSWGWYAGPTVAWVDGDLSDEPMAGIDTGMSFEGYITKLPAFRIDVRYVQRKIELYDRLHSLQVPVLYKRWFDETHYALFGPATSFSYYSGYLVADLIVMAGVGVDISRRQTTIVGLEATYNLGLPYVAGGWDLRHADSLQGLSLRVAIRGR